METSRARIETVDKDSRRRCKTSRSIGLGESGLQIHLLGVILSQGVENRELLPQSPVDFTAFGCKLLHTSREHKQILFSEWGENIVLVELRSAMPRFLTSYLQIGSTSIYRISKFVKSFHFIRNKRKEHADNRKQYVRESRSNTYITFPLYFMKYTVPAARCS
jgi:hypothetical protein